MNQAEIKQFKFFTDAMSIKEDLNNFQQLHKKESYFKSRKYFTIKVLLPGQGVWVNSHEVFCSDLHFVVNLFKMILIDNSDLVHYTIFD